MSAAASGSSVPDLTRYVAARVPDIAAQIRRMADQRKLPREAEAEAHLQAALIVLHQELAQKGELASLQPFIEQRIADLLTTGESKS